MRAEIAVKAEKEVKINIMSKVNREAERLRQANNYAAHGDKTPQIAGSKGAGKGQKSLEHRTAWYRAWKLRNGPNFKYQKTFGEKAEKPSSKQDV